MPIDLHQGPIDPQKSVYQKLLDNLQGNILKSHGRDHAVHLMLKFTAEAAVVRSWMGAFAERYVTSAQRQRQEAYDFRTQRHAGQLFGNLFLSATGYQALGYTPDEDTFPTDRDGLRPLVFRHGMAAHAPLLHDPDPATAWEDAYKARQIDAMILLAHADPQVLESQEQTVRSEVATIANIVATEWGHRLRNTRAELVEPFGYVDGISQPLLLQDDMPAASTSHRLRGDPAAPLDLVLVPDPFAPQTPAGADCFGSYLVFRKLEQKLREFRYRIRDLATHLACSEGRAEALVMGRFKNGTPVVLPTVPETSQPATNDFDYSQDPDGSKCPFQAHIRRLNPRGETGKEATERQRRIVRRSIPYGLPAGTIPESLTCEQLPPSGVGLLFMCFQRSLSNQFGSLQIVWANSLTKNGGLPKFIGPDPVIGQPPDATPPSALPLWPVQWGEAAQKPFDFQGLVTMQGGEFFFAPSLPFFKSLASVSATT